MSYQKQTWRDYDDTKTEVVNMGQGAVVTPERMNHIETGIANSADKQEVAAQLAHTDQKLPKRERLIIEKEGTKHLENFTYTAFFSGGNVRGKEVHVARAGMGHVSSDTAFVAYIKNKNGTFTRKKIEGIDYSLGDYRDPRISVAPTGVTVLTCAVLLNNSTYTNYYFVLDDSFNVVNTFKMYGLDNLFTWGNIISNTLRQTMITAYEPGVGGVALYTNLSNTGEPMNMVKTFELFPATLGGKPTECTLGVWGSKLIAITRRDEDTMLYRETYDLSGKTGWSEVIDLGIIADAPCILPYTDVDCPLILSASYEENRFRVPFIIKFYDPRNVDKIELFIIDELTGRGGYNSMVRNENGFGMVYYEDGANNDTNVYYQEVDIDSIGNNIDLYDLKSKQRFYDTGTWAPNFAVTANHQTGTTFNIQKALYTRIGRLVVAQFQVPDVRPLGAGNLQFTFDLPLERGDAILSGTVVLGTDSRPSSSYISFYSESNKTKVFASIKVDDNKLGVLGISVYYHV